jgi:hypothetical protein
VVGAALRDGSAAARKVEVDVVDVPVVLAVMSARFVVEMLVATLGGGAGARPSADITL